jgi:hypothetical protein
MFGPPQWRLVLSEEQPSLAELQASAALASWPTFQQRGDPSKGNLEENVTQEYLGATMSWEGAERLFVSEGPIFH